MAQVSKNYYNFIKYSSLDRWASYYYQLNEIVKLQVENMLEIGIGEKVLGNYIKNNSDIIYRSLDLAADLRPDIVGSVVDIPVKDQSFDLVAAFEVLEHLPFNEFEKALLEINRITKNYAVISLPHFGPPIKFLLKLPFIKEIKIAGKIFWPVRHAFNGQHYWEIGKKSYSFRKIKSIIGRYFIIKKHFVPFENQYHHFFVLEKINK
ncbi:methyltransferase type 11 [Candidatus Falkowbacteria bacterium CG10_big_fil_rev_8_21_14_0_10_43_11]|uniref:Methyltransferase type 11 n=1 Tax=Candidatus Falkowbacteria bacterium CG10_big_fil_rev_8_21_14_0_10_43_11 TaxID=1974568 RepID=A0A2M6WLP5_9BACT|nr:MAG: methyltransferase type 11 [Candidatus Falkowbacteria bacterium CG10_big_fil_rev_8_21_14_0_10_43_11]